MPENNDPVAASGTIMPSPFSLELTFFDGTQLTFRLREDFQAWADKEKELWSAFAEKCKQIVVPGGDQKQIAREVQQSQVNPITSVLNTLNDPNKLSAAINELNRSYISTTSARGVLILDTAEKDTLTAVTLLSAWNPKIFPLSHTLQRAANGSDVKANAFLYKHLKGIAYANLFDRGIIDNAESEKIALQGIRNDATNLVLEYRGSLEKLVLENQASLAKSNEGYKTKEAEFEKDRKNFKIATDQEFTDLKKELENVKKLFREELALKAPITYWNKKANGHAWMLSIWAVVFTGVIAAFLYNVQEIFKHMTDAVSGLTVAPPTGGVPVVLEAETWTLFLAVTLPIFLGIWLLRLISKTLLSHQNQMNDAKLRAVMTNTFLSLMAEGKADEKDRILILNALFHIPSYSSDDGAPPHWFEIFQTRFSPK